MTGNMFEQYARLQDELVLTALGQASRPARVMHLVFATGLDHQIAERALKRLKAQGKARQSGDNWSLAPEETA